MEMLSAGAEGWKWTRLVSVTISITHKLAGTDGPYQLEWELSGGLSPSASAGNVHRFNSHSSGTKCFSVNV